MRPILCILSALVLAFTAGGCSGCSENASATAACRGAQNGYRCSGCCKSAGAGVGVLVQGVCDCRGGTSGGSAAGATTPAMTLPQAPPPRTK